MSLREVASVLQLIAGILVVGFQIALAAGAPWGGYAMGGAHPGKFPTPLRGAALAQAALLGAAAFAVVSAGGLVEAPWGRTPGWCLWVIVGLYGVSLLLNLATPSRAERRMWAPVATVLFASALVVVLARG